VWRLYISHGLYPLDYYIFRAFAMHFSNKSIEDLHNVDVAVHLDDLVPASPLPAQVKPFEPLF
jgi:hypothetical protein